MRLKYDYYSNDAIKSFRKSPNETASTRVYLTWNRVKITPSLVNHVINKNYPTLASLLIQCVNK